jgi:hypothetical protein
MSAKVLFFVPMALIALFVAAANSSDAFFGCLPSEYFNMDYQRSTEKAAYAGLLALFFLIRAANGRWPGGEG